MPEMVTTRARANQGAFDRETLKRLRLGKKLTKQALAERIGATHQAVSAWESGRWEPRFAQVKKLADEFGLSVEFFLKPGE